MKTFTRYSRSISGSGGGLPMHRSNNPIGVREDYGLQVNSAGKQFYDPDDGSLIGAWLMDEGSGLYVRDHSTQGNHGKIIGADWVADGLDFVSANSDSLVIDSFSFMLDTMSVNFWINSTYSGTFTYLMDGQPSRFIFAWHTDTSNKIGLYDGSSWFSFGDTPNDGDWHLISYLLNSDKARVLIDSVQLGDEETITPIDWSSIVDLKIGSNYIPNSSYFQGTLHSVSMYGKVLLQTETGNMLSAGMYRRTETMKVSNA